jgi:hypothetical protein
MLARLGRPAAPRDLIRKNFVAHLERLHRTLDAQPHIAVLRVDYGTLVERPAETAERINEFLSGRCDVARMAESVDPSLYRNRNPSAGNEPS